VTGRGGTKVVLPVTKPIAVDLGVWSQLPPGVPSS
jgi:hypothetical protein